VFDLEWIKIKMLINCCWCVSFMETKKQCQFC